MPIHVQYTRPHLYPAQEAAIFDARDAHGARARYAFIEASTKAGKTVGCLAWLLEEAWKRRPGDNVWWVAPVYPQAKIAFRRLRRGLPKRVFVSNETENFVRLINGVTIWFKSAEKPDNLYGEDVYACVIDEASRCREEAFFAIRSTLTATGGPVRAIGNVKGRKNWFYRLARRAESGEAGMSYSKLTAEDAIKGGVIRREDVEDARRLLPEQVWKELYMAEPSDDGGNPFGIQHIAACVQPLSGARTICHGIDLAKSVDWTVDVGLDADMATSYFDRFQAPWDATKTRLLAAIGHSHAMVDSTGVGDPIVEDMRARNSSVTGYHFTAQSKQRLMEGLAVAIQSHEVGVLDGQMKMELEAFEYQYTRTGVIYSAPEGFYDDCVCALALAVNQYRAVRPALRAVAPSGSQRISPWLSQARG